MVFVDPVTGKIRQPEPAEIGALTAPPPGAAAAKPAAEPPLEMKFGPAGAVGVVLDSRFESFMVVTKTPDGKLAMDVRDGRPEARTRPSPPARAAEKPAGRRKQGGAPCSVRAPARPPRASLLVLGAPAFGAATIAILNDDPAGVGFNDPTVVAPVGGNPGTTLGQQRLNAFQAAANKWGATLTSGVTIVVRATWDGAHLQRDVGRPRQRGGR